MSAEFPFIGTTSALNTNTLDTFKEWAWDFESDRFQRDSAGNLILLEGNEALKVWIYKALRTERYGYLAYSWQYGCEVKNLIGRVMGVGERKSELRRLVIECLMTNPYIKSVDQFEFVERASGRELEVEISLTTIYGTLEL